MKYRPPKEEISSLEYIRSKPPPSSEDGDGVKKSDWLGIKSVGWILVISAIVSLIAWVAS